MVGFALDCLREAFYGGWADRMILVTYEALAGTRPHHRRALRLRRRAAFAHDFDNVEYSADEFDAALGSPGLHTVRRKVGFWSGRRCCLRSCSSASRTTPSG